MTVREALEAQVNIPLPKNAVELTLINAGIDGAAEYVPADHKKAVELALAGLLLIMVTSPKSVSELDYSMTQQDISDLMNLRSLILKRYNQPDETAYRGAVIQDASNLW